jgi:N-methylhydantoinase A
MKEFAKRGLDAISDAFDAEHKRLFTFTLPLEHEIVTLRAAAQGKGTTVKRPLIAAGSKNPTSGAKLGEQKIYVAGKFVSATVYDRAQLTSGNRLAGPAIVLEMDSTTVILPQHSGTVDRFGNILIYPDGFKPGKR